ncbi:MAG: hypothetical protein SFV81_07055 [Pirellulaceae bacterium]|nr:hypothetical protein [Pirellulaceae bacterium]
MVAANWDDFEFRIPEVLQSHELTRSRNRVPSRELANADRVDALNSLARGSCQPLYQAISVPLADQFNSVATASTRNELVNRYNEVLQSMNTMQEQWTEFLARCVAFDAFNENGGKTPSEQLASTTLSEEWKRQVLSGPVFKPQRLQSIVTAEFVSRNGNDMRGLLVQDCDSLARQLASDCVQQLLDLVESFSIGIAQWYSGHTCCYRFFRRNVRTTSARDTRAIAANRGTAQYVIEAHEHHLMDAYACHPLNAPIEIPSSVRQLVRHSPDWLKGHLRLAVGTLTQEVIHERVISETRWAVADALPRMHFDPALTIGSFVLTAWGPSDIGEVEKTAKFDVVERVLDVEQPETRTSLPLWQRVLGG